MDIQMRQNLRSLLIRHEGLRIYPYFDTADPPKITIGIGLNLTDRGLPLDFINEQFERDIEFFHQQLSSNFTWYDSLCPPRQIALVDMCFMGFKKFCEFEHLIAALEKKDYSKAHDEVLNSLWAKQVGKRSVEIATIILNGDLKGFI